MNLDVAMPLRAADTELQNTKKKGNTRLQQFAAPKPDLDAKAEKRRF